MNLAMICGVRGCDRDPVAYWEEPGGQRHYRCQLHQYELVPQHAVRHAYHLVPGDPAAQHQAPRTASSAKPLREAVRMDQRLVDPDGLPAWVSLVLVPPELAPLFDDLAVSQAMRRVLGPPTAGGGVDAVHFADAVTVDQGDRPDRMVDDPVARLYSARILRVGPGMFGRVAPP